MNKLAGGCIKLGDFEIAIASNKGIPMGIRAKFYVFIRHSFTQIYLPSVKSDISPTVHFYDMVLSAVFIF